MRAINKIIVHCSATPNDRVVTVEEIRRWHVEGNGWQDIGYHYVIYRNGEVHSGRPLKIVGAHCAGQNTGSIGICLIGDDKFTPEQFNSLRILHKAFADMIPSIEIYGHRDFTKAKTCPNFEVKDILN
jgi:N-acetylmuramoyl-L-alanine amidase